MINKIMTNISDNQMLTDTLTPKHYIIAILTIIFIIAILLYILNIIIDFIILSVSSIKNKKHYKKSPPSEYIPYSLYDNCSDEFRKEIGLPPKDKEKTDV